MIGPWSNRFLLAEAMTAFLAQIMDVAFFGGSLAELLCQILAFCCCCFFRSIGVFRGSRNVCALLVSGGYETVAEVVFCEVQEFGRTCGADSRHTFWSSLVAAAAVPL